MRGAEDYARLAPGDQMVLRRLAVFATTFTKDSATKVVAIAGPPDPDVGRIIDRLAASGWIISEENEDGPPRMRVEDGLQPLLMSRCEDAGEREAVETNLYQYALAVAQGAHSALRASLILPVPVSDWLSRLNRERENIATVLDWSGDRADLGYGTKLGLAVFDFWLNDGHVEDLRTWTKKALNHATAQDKNRAELLRAASAAAAHDGDLVRARNLFSESLSLWRSLATDREKPIALLNLGAAPLAWGDVRTARPLLEECQRGFEHFGWKPGITVCLVRLGGAALMAGDLEGARKYFETALSPGIRRTADATTIQALMGLAWVAHRQGDFVKSRTYADQAIEILRHSKDLRDLMTCLAALGAMLMGTGDLAAARTTLEESLGLAWELGEKRQAGHLLANLAQVARSREDFETAMGFCDEALALARQLEDRDLGRFVGFVFSAMAIGMARRGDFARAHGYLEKRREDAEHHGDSATAAACYIGLGNLYAAQKDYGRAFQAGGQALERSRSERDEGGVSIALHFLGWLAIQRGDRLDARVKLMESLSKAEETGALSEIPQILGTLVDLAIVESNPERAVCLGGACAVLRGSFGRPLTRDQIDAFEKKLDPIRAAIPTDAYAAALAKGRSMDIWSAMQYARGAASMS